MIPVLVTLAALPAAMYGVWRARHGYPPFTLPRVLCFHKISNRFCFEGTWTTSRRFAATIDHLRDAGWEFIGEDAFLQALGAPDPANARRVFVTFDDGYAHLSSTALPILGQRGVPFHVFLVTDYTGRENTWDLSLGRPPFRHLDAGAIREMTAAGVTFGSHTASHGDLTRMTPDAVAGELMRSRDAVAELTGRPARTLSYPFGRYDLTVRECARHAGFEAAFSLYPPGRNGDVDRFALRRDAVYIIDPARAVEWKLRPNVIYGLEEMKCRAINAVARLTPLLKRGQPG